MFLLFCIFGVCIKISQRLVSRSRDSKKTFEKICSSPTEPVPFLGHTCKIFYFCHLKDPFFFTVKTAGSNTERTKNALRETCETRTEKRIVNNCWNLSKWSFDVMF